MIISNTNTHITIQVEKKDAENLKRIMHLVQIRLMVGDLDDLDYDYIYNLSENIINQIKQQKNENNL